MRTFKYIDLWVNIGLIILSLLLLFVLPTSDFIIGYFIVGGWQIISMLIHLITKSYFYKGSSRRKYTYLTGIIISLSLFGIVIYPVLFLVLGVLLFAAPLMAVYYTGICYKEVYIKMKRPISILK